VLIDTEGQLGTMSSSRRFKKEIKPMDKASETILALKPVTFYYRNDSTDTPQFGLIAEEVAKVNPNLIVRDKQGEIYTVRYEAVNAMLLNEFLKEHKKGEQQDRKIEQLEATVARLESVLKEQAAQIQKVSAQIELSRAAPQFADSAP
jgi:predicted ribosome quality control (RQC) complex YloA/Tae2 family protein